MDGFIGIEFHEVERRSEVSVLQQNLSAGSCDHKVVAGNLSCLGGGLKPKFEFGIANDIYISRQDIHRQHLDPMTQHLVGELCGVLQNLNV